MNDSEVIDRSDLDMLFAALAGRGYAIVGPTIRDGAIVYDELRSSADLPAGWTDEQEAGRYRLKRRDDDALFGYNVGPHSLKRLQLPENRLLWRARVTADGELTDLAAPAGVPAPVAFLGARSCELHARAILERVLLGGAHPIRASAPPRLPVRDRGPVRPGRRHLLLRLDGHRSGGEGGL